MLTTKPGQDPNIPQADVSIVVNEVALHMDELQVSVCCHDSKLCVVMTLSCVLRVYTNHRPYSSILLYNRFIIFEEQ